MSHSDNHHRLDYVEFGTANVSASKAFFSQVFGWEFTDYGPDYTAFKDGRLEGGFTTQRAPSTDGALLILFSTDLEASQTAVEGAGGQIARPIFSFPGGRRFHLLEPGGNELAIWALENDG